MDDIEIGEYQGPELLFSIIPKFWQGEFNQKFIDYLVENDANNTEELSAKC